MSLSLQDVLRSHVTHTPVVMGVLNVTPDSFSDGGRFLDPAAALDQADRLAREGADVLDIGAESTRPGSRPIPPAEQIARLKDILPAACRIGPLVSIDTTSAEVARFALDAGAAVVNDISAGRQDGELLPLVAQRGSAVVLMHMLGRPDTMQREPRYDSVVAEVRAFLAERVRAAEAAGVPAEHCIVDPGIGFGKTLEHNLALLAGLGALAELGRPVAIGVSRKRFIGTLTGVEEPDRRLAGSLAAACAAHLAGATILRVHDVAATREALAVVRAIHDAARPPSDLQHL